MSRYPRVYALLRYSGHSAQRAAEIILDAQRRDRYSLTWIRAVRRIAGPDYRRAL